jgi:hypothetical protein
MNTTQHCLMAIITLCVSFGHAQLACSQDEDEKKLESTVEAPPLTRSLGSTLGGAYFVDEELVKRHEALKTRLVQIREEIAAGRTTGDAAMSTLAAIEAESQQLRADLEENKVLVAAFQVYSKTTEQTFPLGEERLIIVTGDHVVVRGWEGPGVKCVIQKTIVAKEQPAESEFDAIQVKHELTVAEDKVGLTKEQRDEQERKFLASEDGRKLTQEQLAQRKKLVDEIHQSFDDYKVFQGRQVNSIQLAGLSHQEGNRNLTMRINSPNGGGMVASQWQRHATMTIHVPACRAIALRGCLAGLDVEGVSGDLVLTTHDSKDRNYDGSFTVRGVQGNVNIYQVPVRKLSKVNGDVRLVATDEFVNSGTHHENNTRTYSSYETHTTEIDHVEGDLQATFLRTDLRLSDIKGALDVVNHYGPTQLTLTEADPERTHRLVSESGNINIYGPADVLEKTPMYAHTQCGRLHTNLSREVLNEVNFSSGRPQMGWNGFVTPSKERFDFARFERPFAALENRERTAGLDLISHAGTISILSLEKAE